MGREGERARVTSLCGSDCMQYRQPTNHINLCAGGVIPYLSIFSQNVSKATKSLSFIKWLLELGQTRWLMLTNIWITPNGVDGEMNACRSTFAIGVMNGSFQTHS